MSFLSSSSWISSANSWIEGLLQSPDSLPLALGVLFLGGLLSSLLPCVYPLYPITAGILKSRGTTKASKIIHPSVYYLGLAFAYFLFGIIASASGGSFNQLLRLPLVNIGIAVVIFLLGLSSLELLFLPIFGGRDVSVPSGYWGSALFGLGAGFLSSPCVGPVVVTILLQILISMQSGFQWGLVFLAGWKMFFFGLGLGFPFFLIGVFGASLPRSGKWMKPIQIVLGILVFYFAYSFYLKGMLSLDFTEEQSFALILVVLFVLFGLYKIAFKNHPQDRRIKKALSWSLGLYFLVLFTKLVFFPTQKVQNNLPPETHGDLIWHRDTESAFRLAQDIAQNPSQHPGKVPLVFVDFYADWCSNCKAFSKLTLSDQKLHQALGTAVLLKITDEDPEFVTYQTDERFPSLKLGLPFFLILDAKGGVLYQTTDYLATEAMILHLIPKQKD